ncbi:VanZ family protein [Streptomyces mirabilis]|uniref:VanZ family protein n=1 Tax=Streptomyces mirabilis TaxID=68239 RepID=UPI003645BBAF
MPLVTLVQATVISGRAFDIDDAILNTSGALVGCVCCWAGGWGLAVRPRRRVRDRRDAQEA